MFGGRCAGQLLVLDVRRVEQSGSRRQSYLLSAGQPRPMHDGTPSRRTSVPAATVLGRRDLPSRGLPSALVSPTPPKRSRFETPTRRPQLDTPGDWNKENRRPDCVAEPRRRRRPADLRESGGSRCTASQCPSPEDHHVYHVLEPDADCRSAADFVTSPVYETIDPDDILDLSAERERRSKRPSTSNVLLRRQNSTKTPKTVKRVTFHVSIYA